MKTKLTKLSTCRDYCEDDLMSYLMESVGTKQVFNEYLFLKRNNTAAVEEWGEEPEKCFYAFSHLLSFSPLQAEWDWIFCKCGALFAIAPSDMRMGHSDQWIKTTGEGCWLNLLTFHPLTCRDGASSAWLSQPRRRLEEPAWLVEGLVT